MKKNYLKPGAEYVKLVVGPIMQIVEGSTWTGTGTGDGEVGDESEELSNRRKGEWGNLWKK